MTIPGQHKITNALLIELYRLGGTAKPKEVYDLVAQHFPDMNEEDLRAELDCGHNVFRNRVQWARQTLVVEGHIDRSVRGIWTLTDKGLKKAKVLVTGPPVVDVQPTKDTSLIDLVDRHDKEVRGELLQHLINVSPSRFEKISGQLLRKLGFREVAVTRVSNDGGIDGYGRLKMGIVAINAAFQCKRYQAKYTVGRPEVDAFRGATQGRFDQAIFITTSTFSKQASEESLRPGTIPIIMIDGERMLDLMVEHGIGVNSRPLMVPQIDEDYFAIDDDSDN